MSAPSFRLLRASTHESGRKVWREEAVRYATADAALAAARYKSARWGHEIRVVYAAGRKRTPVDVAGNLVSGPRGGAIFNAGARP